ncbi:AT-hook motif nuclear-localized protein 7-like [Glycine soja]|uniref:AT-hook motif nuclear-localized protein n=1 Tax=Glycine soja TaxID=3848 RepID=A0A445HG91_GLYSO|nr:AT-hook motif nuclear-localized protein 7-like [Glycine soja]RZB72638.1 AT-hook motif nuclear-localized protein 1 [Glycine soja]
MEPTTTLNNIINNNNTVPAGSPPPPPPPSVPQPMNMNVNMNMNVGNTEGTTPAVPTPTPAPTPAPTTMVPAVPAPTTTTPGSLDLFGKKKRGRPRKYDADGNLRVSATPPPPPGFTLSTPSEFSSSKRGRGKHNTTFGNNNYQQLYSSFGEVFANTAGGDFVPHVVTVYTGEDVAGKIVSFAQKGPRGICILSANGAISNVTIRQPGSSGGILTYEGRFEILSLSGSFTVADNSGMKSRTGGLSVSLAGPDGRVIGGGVAGLLTAAGPIQIVVGSFMQNGYKAQKRKYQREQQIVVTPTSAGPEIVTAVRPISQTNADGENFLIPMSQIPDQNQRESVSVSSDKQNLDATPDAATWNGSEEYSDQRTSPDINISLPDE